MIDDQDLRRALGRREPPAGFAERTLARIKSHRASPLNPQSKRAWQWMAAGMAASLILAVGINEVTTHRRDVAAKKNAEELTIALRITSEKLNDVRVRLEHRQPAERTGSPGSPGSPGSNVERNNVEQSR